jgi:uncharacterized membrane protein
MLFAISLYDVSVFVHVSAVVVGFGATFALALAFPLAINLHPQHLPFVHRLSRAINQRFVGPALGLILLTGIYQAADGDWGFEKAWIGGTFLIAIILGGLSGGYFMPTDRKLEAMATRELSATGAGEQPAKLSEEYQRRAQREGGVGALAGFLVIVAVFLMVTKPGT